MQQRIAEDDLATWVAKRAGGSRRFLFGIAGAPGSGKSTLAARLAHTMNAIVVPMDGFHLPNAELDRRGLRHVKGAPQTFDADAFVRAVSDIRRDATDVLLPDFDRVSDEPRPDSILVPRSARNVIVEGNYLLLDSAPWNGLRGVFDAIAHLDIDGDVRVGRLIDRHVRFGRSRTEATAFAQQSDEPNAGLVEAVAHRAHVVVTSTPASGATT